MPSTRGLAEVRSLRALAVLVTASLTACFPRPLDMHVQDAQTGAPIEGVALHKHAISLLSLLPSRQEPVQSKADGSARVWVPPLNTNITLLRPGYEPASVAVFKKEFPASMQGDFEMRMKPCTRTTMEVRVIDAENGQPVEGAEVLARTFLYLPAPGLEEGWGFPHMQCVPTAGDGLSKIEQI